MENKCSKPPTRYIVKCNFWSHWWNQWISGACYSCFTRVWINACSQCLISNHSCDLGDFLTRLYQLQLFLDPNNQAKTNPRLAHHGAGICLHLQNCATFGVNVGVHIPAPWASHRLELQAVGWSISHMAMNKILGGYRLWSRYIYIYILCIYINIII